MAPTLIDSHVHFWNRDRFDYAWLEGEDPQLRRTFLPGDLPDEHVPVVAVQADCAASQGLDEARWLSELADRGAPIIGVVAHAPLETGDAAVLEALAGLPWVTGVRRLLQDEPTEFITSDALVAGVQSLAAFDLSMDLCVRGNQLDAVADLVQRCPEVTFVLDHLGKPTISSAAFPGWSAALARVARLPNVHCKLSGLLTEAPPEARSSSVLRPWLDAALESFGIHRVLFGSDWPVLLTAGDREIWLEIVESALSGSSEQERAAVFGENAHALYARGRKRR